MSDVYMRPCKEPSPGRPGTPVSHISALVPLGAFIPAFVSLSFAGHSYGHKGALYLAARGPEGI